MDPDEIINGKFLLTFDKQGNLIAARRVEEGQEVPTPDPDELIMPDGKRVLYLGGLVKDERETLETD